MSNILSQQDPYCIINSQGLFIFVNERFLNLFNVSEQECYNGMKLQDFIVSPNIISIFQPSYKEIVFKNTQGSYFAAFLTTTLIQETGLFATSIRILSKDISTKRIITSFRRYIDSQVALICLEYSGEHFLPVITLNTDIIDDNPSFVITIGTELTSYVKNSVRNIKNFSGLLHAQKFEHYQNYYFFPFVFQLLVPGLESITEIITETFVISVIFPTPLLELFKDEERLKKTIQEHLSQLNSPNELSVLFLEEIKQKLVLYFNSQSMQSLTNGEQNLHNLDVYSNYLTSLPYLEAIKLFSEFCVKNFNILSLAIFQIGPKGYEKLFSIEPPDRKAKSFPVIFQIENEVFSESFTKKPIQIENYYYIPYYNKSNEILGFLGIQPSQNSIPSIDDISAYVAEKLANLFDSLVQTNIGYLRSLIEHMLEENSIPEIFNTVKNFVIKIFGEEIKVFAALEYDSETETLNFVSQSGYLPTFNVKSIALNSKNSVVAKSGREKIVLNIPDVLKCQFYLEGDPTVRSELAIPLVYNSQLIGVLNIESQKINAFSTNYHQPLFQLICDLFITNYVRISAVKKIGKMNLL